MSELKNNVEKTKREELKAKYREAVMKRGGSRTQSEWEENSWQLLFVAMDYIEVIEKEENE